MQEIMQYLKANGQRFDSEIAAATGLSLAKVRRSISDLSARGEISKCSVTRFSVRARSAKMPPPQPTVSWQINTTARKSKPCSAASRATFPRRVPAGSPAHRARRHPDVPFRNSFHRRMAFGNT